MQHRTVIAEQSVQQHRTALELQVLPEAPAELVQELSRRYVYLYERITGIPFIPPPLDEAIDQRMARNVAAILQSS